MAGWLLKMTNVAWFGGSPYETTIYVCDALMMFDATFQAGMFMDVPTFWNILCVETHAWNFWASKVLLSLRPAWTTSKCTTRRSDPQKRPADLPLCGPSGSRTPNSHSAGDIPILAVQYVGRREYKHVRNELSKDVSIVLHDMVGMAASKIFGGQPAIFLDNPWFVTKCCASVNLTN